MRSKSIYQRNKWIPFQLAVSGVSVPPFGIMALSNISSDGTLETLPPGASGHADDVTGEVFCFNSEKPISDTTTTGWCTFEMPTLISCDGNPQFGELWGPEDNNFRLVKEPTFTRTVSFNHNVTRNVDVGGGCSHDYSGSCEITVEDKIFDYDETFKFGWRALSERIDNQRAWFGQIPNFEEVSQSVEDLKDFVTVTGTGSG